MSSETIEQLTPAQRLGYKPGDSFAEFKSDAAIAKMDAIIQTEELIEKAVLAENERTELEILRKVSERRAQLEREEKPIREAEERARKQAEAAEFSAPVPIEFIAQEEEIK